MISSAVYRLGAMPPPFAPARILAQDLERFWGAGHTENTSVTPSRHAESVASSVVEGYSGAP